MDDLGQYTDPEDSTSDVYDDSDDDASDYEMDENNTENGGPGTPDSVHEQETPVLSAAEYKVSLSPLEVLLNVNFI